jgi:hypothetical protein
MNKTIIGSLLSLSLLFAFGAAAVSAQTRPPSTSVTNQPDTSITNEPRVPAPTNIKIPNPFARQDGDLFDLIKLVVDTIILPVGGILCVLAFIYSGFMYVTAQGNSKKIEDANRALLYSAIGTAVLLGSKLIADVISGTVDQLK